MKIQNRQATLLTASCLKSWWSWTYGQLWLFSDGLLRLPLPWWTAFSFTCTFPTITPGSLKSRTFEENDFLKLTLDPKSLWIPRCQITNVSFGGDRWTQWLNIQLIEARTIKLLWMRPDNASEPLAKALTDWGIVCRDAEPLYKRAFLVCKRYFESDHPLTQLVRKNYALLLRAMKRDVEAQQMEEET